VTTPLLPGRVGLVTGAAGGIGRATALVLAREGAVVVVSDLASRAAEGEKTVELVTAAGGTAEFVACDIVVEADHEALVAGIVERHGRLDYAVNNAGIEYQGELHETPREDFERVLQVNLVGVWLGMKHQIRAMRAQGSGAIVSVASLAGLLSPPALGAYVASKHGVVGLTKTAAVENAQFGIRVNAVCPAPVRTPLMDVLTPDQLEMWVSRMAIHRLGEPAEVGQAIAWLCSDDASFVTGFPLPVDGGAYAR
jgi:NAD(P)-dependent dehydrogenase (short-subunit alcohol dehydrogenase family)